MKVNVGDNQIYDWNTAHAKMKNILIDDLAIYPGKNYQRFPG